MDAATIKRGDPRSLAPCGHSERSTGKEVCMTIEDFLARLDGVRKSGQRYMARCPAHQDRNPSLSIREGERGVLVRCFAGCSYQEIMAAIGETPAAGFYD